jgi:hypothetical protein
VSADPLNIGYMITSASTLAASVTDVILARNPISITSLKTTPNHFNTLYHKCDDVMGVIGFVEKHVNDEAAREATGYICDYIRLKLNQKVNGK